jgi:hypothetical protein
LWRCQRLAGIVGPHFKYLGLVSLVGGAQVDVVLALLLCLLLRSTECGHHTLIIIVPSAFSALFDPHSYPEKLEVRLAIFALMANGKWLCMQLGRDQHFVFS